MAVALRLPGNRYVIVPVTVMLWLWTAGVRVLHEEAARGGNRTGGEDRGEVDTGGEGLSREAADEGDHAQVASGRRRSASDDHHSLAIASHCPEVPHGAAVRRPE